MGRRLGRTLDGWLATLLICGALGLAFALGAVALFKRPARRPSGPTSLPQVVLTDRGIMLTEEEYLPGVVDCEIAHFTESPAALEAQAVAARTYLARHLSTHGNVALVPIGPHFQCWRQPVHDRSRAAVEATHGHVARWRGSLINANYAAGTQWMDKNCQPLPPILSGYRQPSWAKVATDWRKGTRFPGPAWTQIFVTDNRSKKGDAVQATLLGSSAPPNRGALGQHASICLAERRGWDRVKILRAFYGNDIEIGP
jgi:hypothetical protein